MLFVLKTEIDRNKIISYLKRLPTKDLLGYKINIQSIRHTRSLNQNKYYWGVIIKMLGDEFGYIAEEMHDALRMRFLQVHTNKLPTIKSTTELSTKEMEEYLSKIRQWASEQGIFLPLPNEVILE